MAHILQTLEDKKVLLADGAIGTNLFAKGLETGDAPELWNVDEPHKITELHQEFVDAGADILLTNTFGANEFRLKLHQAESRVKELNMAAVTLARAVADKAGRDVAVAGSIGPTGELFAPLGQLDKPSAVAAFKEQAVAMAEAGADCLWIETMSSAEEMEACVEAIKTVGLPVFATMTFDTAGRTMMGIKPGEFSTQADALGLDAYGANCGIGPAELLDTVKGFRDAGVEIAVIAKGNCGIPSYVEGEIHYHGTPELMAEYAICARAAGARIIGGCCGTTPAHLAAMRAALDSDAHAISLSDDEIIAKLGEPWAAVATDAGEANSRPRGRRRGRNKG